MNEKFNETGKEFEELSNAEKTELLNDYQETLEDKDDKPSNDVAFLGNTGDTKAIKDAKKHVQWAADNGFTGYHRIKAENELKRAQDAKARADELTKK